MKRNFVLTIAAALSIIFFACKEDDIPVPLPPPPLPLSQSADDSILPPPTAGMATPNSAPAVAKQVPAAEKPAPAKEKVANTAEKATFFAEYSGDTEQLNYGRYTIQVAIFPNPASAKALVKKIEESGIKAYYAKVSNPAKLLGSYYRVRIGFFNEKPAAKQFAKTRLEPLGYKWWVDERKNDTVGNKAVQIDVSVQNDSLEAAKQAYRELAQAAVRAISSSSAVRVSSSSRAAPPLPAVPK